MEWIYISPHLDDVALSLGGLLWEQSKAGWNVSIWTICAGDPPPGEFSPFAQSLHERWKTGHLAMERRRKEDIDSCAILNSQYHHFSIPDCIYRRSLLTGEYLYESEDDLWSQVHPDELQLIDQLGQLLNEMLPTRANIVCPIALGNHVDHLLTRMTVEDITLISPQNHQWNFYYYADFPYVLDIDLDSGIKGLNYTFHQISTNGIVAWQEAISSHQSQISTFWSNTKEMRYAIQSYYDQMGGIWLGWK